MTLLIAAGLAWHAWRVYPIHPIRQRIERADTFIYDYNADRSSPKGFEHRRGDPSFDKIKKTLLAALSNQSGWVGWGGERMGDLTCRASGDELLAIEVWADGFWANGSGFEAEFELHELLVGRR